MTHLAATPQPPKPGPPEHSMQTPPMPRAETPPWRRWLPLAILAGIMAVIFLNGWHKLLTLEAIVGVRDRFQSTIVEHRLIALLAFVAAYTVMVSLSLPGASAFTLSSGLLFGWVQGGLAAVIGATIGASIIFAIARTAFGETLAAKAGPQIAKLQEGFKENALSYLLFLRLVPAFPFFIVNIVPALLGVPFRTYLIGTFVGIIPATFAFASIGAGLDSVIASAKAEQAVCLAAKAGAQCPLSIQLANLVTTELKIAFALLSVLALIPVVLKKWRQRHGR